MYAVQQLMGGWLANNGDIFTVDTSGNSAQITIGLGKLDGMIDQAISGVETVLSGLSCGFGDP